MRTLNGYGARMRGIVRPCRHHLGPELHARWQAHLCGLCLTLRDAVGQPERVLTGYDVLLLSVLVEAQAGAVETTTAAPCPLRGFTRATVVASASPAGRLAAAGALVSAAAGLADKIVDDDLPRPVRPSARRVAARLDRSGTALARSVDLDPSVVLAAPAASAAAEAVPGADLRSLLAASGDAVASLFAHTAVVAGRPGNREPLARCGRAFGALVHLLDAVEDHASDAAAGRFNPLTATHTPPPEARLLADQLVAEVREALSQAELADPALVEVLLGRELVAAVDRALPRAPGQECCGAPSVPVQRNGTSGLLALLVALWALLAPAVFIGGSWGGGRRRPPRGWPPPRGYPPPGYPPPGYGPGYGYRSVGPSCSQLLACNCCANLACNACCCGSSCANG